MKKLVLAVFVALLAVGLAAPPARAVYILPAGEYRAGVTDRSSLFSNDTAEGLGEDINVGDEQRSVLRINSINFGEKKVGAGGVKFVSDTGGGSPPYTNSLLTGMVYDLTVADVVLKSTKVSVIDTTDSDSDGSTTDALIGTDTLYRIYKGLGARFSSGDPDTEAKKWKDTIPSVDGTLVTDTTDGVDYGGILVIYEDPALNLELDGPSDWTAHGGSDISGVLSDPDEFTTISDDGTPWLVGVFADIADIPGNPFGVAEGTFLLEDNYTIASGTGEVDGTGRGFVNVIGGSGPNAMQWAVDNFTIDDWRTDIRIDFDIDGDIDVDGPGSDTGSLADGWQIESDDPTQFGILPEPATMSLLGMGLVGLVGAYYKRKKRV
jgi:hypothetical protein